MILIEGQHRSKSASFRLSSTENTYETHFCLCHKLEESNRTLTVDVANLASEKEELNNQLKELKQREYHIFSPVHNEQRFHQSWEMC